jgi:hypothetical protein
MASSPSELLRARLDDEMFKYTGPDPRADPVILDLVGSLG